MNINRNLIRRPAALLSALALLAGGLAPALVGSVANAAGQVTARSIQLSDARPGTAAQYKVTFTPVTTSQELIIDFCGDSPIVGSTCAFVAGTSVPAISSPVSSVGSATSANGRTVKVTGLTMTAATPFTLTFTSGFTNPTQAAGTFYARILTYTTANAANYVPAASTGAATTIGAGNVDTGGAALSTSSQITVSATVQESLTFCVSGSVISGTCSGLSAPALTIGTGSPAVLTTAGQGTPAYTQLSTNATSGVNVRMKAINLCSNGGLTTSQPDIAGGCASIPGIGSSAVVLTAGTWGMCVAPGAGVTAATNYLDSTNSCPTTFNATSKYGMNGTNLTSTFGDTVYSTPGAVNAIGSTLTFAAMAANTTPAGVYGGNESLIATGTF